MKKKVKEAIQLLIDELGSEYDNSNQLVIYTGLYEHSDGELYTSPEYDEDDEDDEDEDDE